MLYAIIWRKRKNREEKTEINSQHSFGTGRYEEVKYECLEINHALQHPEIMRMDQRDHMISCSHASL